MKSLTTTLIAGLVIGCLAGCDEPMQAEAAQPPAGYRIVQKVDTPATTTIETPGKEITRDVTMWRWASPFGASPGEVLMAQDPMELDKSTTPGLDITPEGATQTISTQGKFIGGAGGGTWYQMLMTKLKDWGLLLGGGLLLVLVGGAVLYFMVPAAKPIINGILRLIASVFPFLGSVVEKAVGDTKVAEVKKPLVEVIDTVQQFKKLVKYDETLSGETKGKIANLLGRAYAESQDSDTQVAVKQIKAGI